MKQLKQKLITAILLLAMTVSAVSACDTAGGSEHVHDFGNWVYEGSQGYRTCATCGFREYASDSTTSATNSSANSVEYANFDKFMAACDTVGDHELRYKGKSNSFTACLIDGDYACDSYTIRIPSRVTSVTFKGNAQGTPFQDVKIILEDRFTSIEVAFEDIMIESQTTILESETRYINVNVSLNGQCCILSVVGKAADGANGRDKVDFSAEAQAGENGQDGAPALFVNGKCTLICSAETIVIKGGDGGNGGNGGTPVGIHFGWGGAGGNGGNGGNAVGGESLATVRVTSKNWEPNLIGGQGGQGGSGGAGRGINQEDGANGSAGVEGTTGCLAFTYGNE